MKYFKMKILNTQKSIRVTIPSGTTKSLSIVLCKPASSNFSSFVPPKGFNLSPTL
jgi:hypothetical protein